MRQHNIISAIPRTDQTDPAKFPPYEYQEYPKMLLGKDGKNICDSLNQPMIFQDEQSLEEFLEANPTIAEEIRDREVSSTKKLAMENDVLKKLLAENERLRAKLGEDEESDDEEEIVEAAAPKKRRPKKRYKPDKPLRTLK